MELFLFCWALAWLIQQAVVDTTHAVRGTVSPRMQVKLARAHKVDPVARYGAGDYMRDLWADSWSGATVNRRRRKAEKAAAEVEPAVDQPAVPRRSRVRGTATTEPWAAPVMPTPTPADLDARMVSCAYPVGSGVEVCGNTYQATPDAMGHLMPDNCGEHNDRGDGWSGPAPVTDRAADRGWRDRGWRGASSDAGRQLIDDGKCGWGGNGQAHCGAPRDGDSPFCWLHTDTYVDEFGERPAAPAQPWTAPVMTSPAPDPAAEDAVLPGVGQIAGPDDVAPEGQVITEQHVRDYRARVEQAHRNVGLPTEKLWGGAPVVPTAQGDENPAGTASQGTPDYLSTYTDEERRYWSAMPAALRPHYFRRGEEAAANAAEPVSPADTETSASTAFPGPLATVTPITRNINREDPTMTSTTDPSLSGETVSLVSARTYADGMAKAATAGTTSVEQSLAHLNTSEVTGEALAHLATAQEALSTAAAAFTAAHAALGAQLAVKDAYEATPSAGTKEFVTGE